MVNSVTANQNIAKEDHGVGHIPIGFRGLVASDVSEYHADGDTAPKQQRRRSGCVDRRYGRVPRYARWAAVAAQLLERSPPGTRVLQRPRTALSPPVARLPLSWRCWPRSGSRILDRPARCRRLWRRILDSRLEPSFTPCSRRDRAFRAAEIKSSHRRRINWYLNKECAAWHWRISFQLRIFALNANAEGVGADSRLAPGPSEILQRTGRCLASGQGSHRHPGPRMRAAPGQVEPRHFGARSRPGK